MSLRIPPCPVCGHGDTYLLREAGGAGITECAKCRTLFDVKNPRTLWVFLAGDEPEDGGWVAADVALTRPQVPRGCLAAPPGASRRMADESDALHGNIGICRLPKGHSGPHRATHYPIIPRRPDFEWSAS